MIPQYELLFPGKNSEIIDHLHSLPWETKVKARKELFMSEVPGTIYKYDKYDDANQYTSVPYTKPILDIVTWINEKYNTQYNLCFMNRYDTQHDHIGWHADDSNIMDTNHPIATISFGEEREIWFKIKSYKGIIPDAQRQKLANGSIFIMPAGFQETHLHRIPKNDRPCGTRFSLTLRKISN